MIINKNRRRSRQTKCGSLLLIRLNPCFGLVAVDIFSEAINVQSDHSGISAEQSARVLGLAPNRLFPIEQVVHFPKTVLETRRFRRQRRFARVLMACEREMTKDHSQTRTVLAFELVNRLREIRTRRTLEVSKFDNCHRRVGASTNVNHLCAAHCGYPGIFGDCQSRKPLGAIEHRPASDCD